MIYTTNYLPVIIAALGSFVIGFLWYSEWLFGKKWMSLMKITPEQIEEGKKKGMAMPMLVTGLFAIVTAFIFFVLAQNLLVLSVGAALTLAVLLWLGFSVPIFLNSVFWESKPWGLFWISSLQILASLAFTALIYSWFV